MTADLVYSDHLTSVFHGDARALPLDDNSAGMVITSPPYNCKARYDGYEDWLPWDEYWHGLIVPFLRESIRVLVPGGRLCVNFANVINTPNGEDWAVLVDEHFFSTVRQIDGALPRERIGWNKGDTAEDVTTTSVAWGSWLSASTPVLRATAEPIYIVDKLTHKRPPGRSDITRDEFMAWTRNSWFVPVRGLVTGRGANPCQFPLEIPRRLMKLYGYVDDVVVDPFCGEGTTLLAAKKLGRKSVGIEQGLKQCRRAANRVRQDVMFTDTDCAA